MNPRDITLTTPRLVMRPIDDADLEALLRIGGHLAVARNTGTFTHPFTREQAAERLARCQKSLADRTGLTLTIRLRDSGVTVGTTGFFNLNREHNHAEVGYILDPDRWGRGYATESLHAVVRHAFNDWNIRRLYACYFADNPGSGRVLEKCGFRHEGVRRKHMLRFGQYRDDVMMGLLKEEYEISGGA